MDTTTYLLLLLLPTSILISTNIGWRHWEIPFRVRVRVVGIGRYLVLSSFCAEGAGPSGTVLVLSSFCAEGVRPSGTVSLRVQVVIVLYPVGSQLNKVWAGTLVTMSNGLRDYEAFFREAQRYSTRESILLLLISSELLIYLLLQSVIVIDYLSILQKSCFYYF